MAYGCFTCVFESDTRWSQSSLNNCGLIPLSPFPNGYVHLKCLYHLFTLYDLRDLLLVGFGCNCGDLSHYTHFFWISENVMKQS